MVAILVFAASDSALQNTLVGVGATAVFTFGGLLVRLLVKESNRSGDLVAHADARATSAEERSSACEARAIAAEQRLVAAIGRADLLDLQLDEVRRQLESLRLEVPAARPAPKRKPPP